MDNRYDYVLLPDGRKKRISSIEDIENTLAEWEEYIQNNWLTPRPKMFDPESKVKYMLEGLANIILRPNMTGLLTEYQKMKIKKYEIPISSCATEMADELYSERPKIDNGEGRAKMLALINDLANAYDEAKKAKTRKAVKQRQAAKKNSTRRQRIEAARRTYAIKSFEFTAVRTDNEFMYGGARYVIDGDLLQYAPTTAANGEECYNMDKVLCGTSADGHIEFFDMSIKNISEHVKRQN